MFTTITFDDPDTLYGLTDFGGAASTVTNDPAGGMNMVAMVLRTDSAATFAGTTVSTLDDARIPPLPLDATNARLSVRVFAPAAGIPVRLKIEDATAAALSVETEATTTVGNAWETLIFDFSDEVPGTPAFDAANTYDRVSIFFNFGAEGATAGEQIFYFDDIAVATDGGEGAPDGGLDAVVYATDPTVAEDLAPLFLDNFGSGSVFVSAYALDPVFNPVLAVTSGEGYGRGTHVGFVAFLGYTQGFAADFESLVFKVKDLPANTIEVKFFGGTGDNSMVYDVATYAGATDLGNGWYQGAVPVSDFAVTIDSNDGFLLGPLGDQGAPFTFLLTDIGFRRTSSGQDPGGDTGDQPPGELAVNGDLETGDLTGWTVFENGGSITADDSQSSSGDWSLHVVAGRSQNPVIKQFELAAGTVMPGDSFAVSFDMLGAAGAGGVIFPEFFSERAEGATNEILDTITVPVTNWTTYSYTATAGADVTNGVTFQIGVVCGDVEGCFADVFVDNVSVRTTP
jgi:hypothetical protein